MWRVPPEQEDQKHERHAQVRAARRDQLVPLVGHEDRPPRRHAAVTALAGPSGDGGTDGRTCDKYNK